MNQTKTRRNALPGLSGVIFLSILFVCLFYSKIIIHPNSYLFSSDGDAMKNYYTYAYFIKNNVSNTNFEGMNYPYGEHYLYTDCHPAIASLLKTVKPIFPEIVNYSIGIINFLMIFSMIITVLLLYLIFIELKINRLLSVLSALAIMVLSPQIFRMTGHLALSYSCFIPLTLYLLIKFENSNYKIKYGVSLIISNLFWLFIHAYLGMIAITLIFTYTFVKFISEKLSKSSINVRNYGILLSAAILPILSYIVFLKLTDIHTGRTTNPWGIFVSYADFSTIFLPNHQPLNSIIRYFIPKFTQHWEGWAYIGIISIASFVFYIVKCWQKTKQNKKLTIDSYWLDNKLLRNLLFASLIILLFSMLFPFRLGLEGLLKYLEIIKQFRAIGRFAWVFYFVIAIISVYFTNKIFYNYLGQGRIVLVWTVLIIVPLIIFYEGIYYHIETSDNITKTPNLFDIHQLDASMLEDLESIDGNKYQAIIPLPFYYIGSENFGKEGNNKIYKLSQLFSYHLSLPVIGSYLTRTSIWESKNLMQLFSDNFYTKAIQKDLPNNKPFLIIYDHSGLSKNENYYLAKAKVLFNNPEYTILEIEKQAFFESTAKEELTAYKAIQPKLFNKKGFLVSDTSKFLYYNDFEDSKSEFSFRGKGALNGVLKDYTQLASFKKGELKPNTQYTIRLWMYNKGKNYGQDQLGGIVFIQEKVGNEVKWMDPYIKPTSSQVINGAWSLIELPFVPTRSDAEYNLMLKGDDYSDKRFYIDDLLIYDSSLEIYKFEHKGTTDVLFKNDHQIVVSADTKH
jgi:hypothetical protein